MVENIGSTPPPEQPQEPLENSTKAVNAVLSQIKDQLMSAEPDQRLPMAMKELEKKPKRKI